MTATMALHSPACLAFIILKLNNRSIQTQVPKYKTSIIMQNLNSTRSLYTRKLYSTKSENNLGNISIATEVFDANHDHDSDSDNDDDESDDGNGNVPPPGNDGGYNGGGDDDDDENEFGPSMKFDDVIKMAELNDVSLPGDKLEAAKVSGLCKLIVDRYLDLQV